jgi:hypothetical protein
MLHDLGAPKRGVNWNQFPHRQDSFVQRLNGSLNQRNPLQLKQMVDLTGLEPVTSSMSRKRSNQLS